MRATSISLRKMLSVISRCSRGFPLLPSFKPQNSFCPNARPHVLLPSLKVCVCSPRGGLISELILKARTFHLWLSSNQVNCRFYASSTLEEQDEYLPNPQKLATLPLDNVYICDGNLTSIKWYVVFFSLLASMEF